MANIEKELKAIMEAEYGEEVRSSIHDAIEAGNKEIIIYGIRDEERAKAETARAQAETARVDAEAVRVQMETARKEAEAGRVLAENGRAQAEMDRTNAETARRQMETVRLEAENAREEVENERVLAESGRVSGESERILAETERVEAEALRAQAEELRRQAEDARAVAEELREVAKVAAEAATKAANEAAEKANAVAEGGISKRIVDFEEAEAAEGLESGETLGTLFGKAKKWFSDLASGAAGTMLGKLFSSGKVLVSNENGGVAESEIATGELLALKGITGNIQEQLAELNDNILLRAYPAGSIYLSVNNVNPGTLFGGTWVAWGSGRMPIGVNPSDANFNAPGKTGGSESHSHGMDHTHSGMNHSHGMDHTHSGMNHSHSTPNHTHTIDGWADVDLSQANNEIKVNRSGYVHSYTYYAGKFSSTPAGGPWTGSNSTASVGGTAQSGGGGSTGASGTLKTGEASAENTGASGILTTGGASAENTGSASSLPPYITCYMWKRTA